MMKRRMAFVAFAVSALLGADHPAASAAPSDPRDASRNTLNGILSILRLRPDATSPACVSALEEMHTAEDQLKALNNSADEPTESARHANRQDDIAVAQDVLGSDVDNSISSCRPDAKIVCGGHPNGGAKLCEAL